MYLVGKLQIHVSDEGHTQGLSVFIVLCQTQWRDYK